MDKPIWALESQSPIVSRRMWEKGRFQTCWDSTFWWDWRASLKEQPSRSRTYPSFQSLFLLRAGPFFEAKADTLELLANTCTCLCYHSRSSGSTASVNFLTTATSTWSAMIKIDFDITFRRKKYVFGKEDAKEDVHFWMNLMLLWS